MTKKTQTADNTAFALEILKQEHLSVGDFIESIDEGDDTVSYLFKSELKGYVDWRWSVTVYQPKGAEPTLSEFVLLPGAESLVAPDWVPWSERLADYKALQLELERQAALDAEEAAEGADADDSDDADDDDIELVEVDEDETTEADQEPELLSTESDEGDSAEDDSDNTGKRPPRSRGRNRRGKSKKND
jgi:hypothetical protein